MSLCDRTGGRETVGRLRRLLGDHQVIEDPDVAQAYRHDQATVVPAGQPLAVVFPESAEQVAGVLRLAADTQVPVVPRGAGSGLSGGANAIDDGIVLCTTRMDRIVEIDEDNLLAVVQPGVVNGDLARRARELGLFYPPDPASRDFCTIGGNVATNAGGLCCLRYGVTAEYVLGLQMALADGNLVRVGRRTIKGVAGYDLTRLVVGSEGTLGVVTEATLRLVPAPPPVATLVATFPALVAAGRAVAELTRCGVPLSMLEIMDRTTLRAVESYARMDLDTSVAALLLIQVDADSAALRAGEIERLCTSTDADFVVCSTDPDEASQLTTVRQLAHPALEQMGTSMLDDVCVPRSRIPDLLEGTQALAESHEVTVGVFGHAGDGNMHPTIVYDAGDPLSQRRAVRCFVAITQLALELGGTVSGEHGIGALKQPFLGTELDTVAIELTRRVKQAFDPLGILNPGRASPWDSNDPHLVYS